MTTIQIAHEVPDATVAKIQAFLADIQLRDINWNGANFKVERDDYTCIPDDESYNAASLLTGINKIIDGE